MHCSNCGKELRENAKFCSFCGTTVEPEPEKAVEDVISGEAMSEEAAQDSAAEEKAVQDNAIEETPEDDENNNDSSEPKKTDEDVISGEAISEEAAQDSAAEEKAVQDNAIEETPTDKKEDTVSSKINTSDFTAKFQEENGLFVIKEQVSDIPSTAEFLEKKNIPWVKISVAVLCAAAIGVSAYIIPQKLVPAIQYSNAQKLYESGDYHGAITAFEKLDKSKKKPYCEEAYDYIIKCRYGIAEQLFGEGRFEEAADAFSELDGYADSNERAAECMIATAENYIAEGDFDSAMSIYAAAGKADLAEQTALKKIETLAENGEYFKAAEIAENYCSEDIVTEYRYMGALAAKDAGDFKTAADNFYKLGDYGDSKANAEECTYSFYMSEYTQNGPSEEIARGFYFLGNFRNSHDMFVKACYEYGLECEKKGDHASAVAMFKNCGTYKDAINDFYRSRYNLGKALLDSDPASARSVFALLSTYGDSSVQKKTAAAKLSDSHMDWYADGFTSVGDYYTTVFNKSDTLLISCTAGTETISAPTTLVLTLSDCDGNTVTADCENVRNSGSFSGSFSLSSMSSGKAQIIIARKDNGTVLRTIDVTIT